MKESEFGYKRHRNYYTVLNEVFFWNNHHQSRQHVLIPDENKMTVINNLQWLVQNKLINIYGYVIMPNHIHLMLEQLNMNGAAFLKIVFKSLLLKRW